VFAAGQAQLRPEADGRRRLLPVSISYPEGDPGREDELIAAIAGHWNSPVHWLDIERIPLFDEPALRAGQRDVPFAHTYEHWNRALARGSRATGTRIALDGNGGDQLFQVSDIFLADLFRTGRWTSLAREWRQKGGRDWRTFARWVVLPAMPTAFQHAVAAARGREERDYLDRALPFWVREDFATRHGLRERERRTMPGRRGYRGWRREAHFFLSAPSFPRAFQCLSGLALEEGVELRSPLYDRRIVEFACSRPRAERNAGKETKRLLRAAMSGLLPDHVLAPRDRRTGITTAYSDRRMREVIPELLEHVLESPILADLGIIEPSRVRVAWAQYLRTGDLSLKIPLFLTIQVELWLRARMPRAARAPINTTLALGQLVT
jgi:asparagine synthase (glutamine-hydrolysing)